VKYASVSVVGRYAVDDLKADAQEVWRQMIRMFIERETSWLRSYYDLKLRTDVPVRTGSEYEIVGTGGGHYSLTIIEWNSGLLRFGFRIGLDKEPNDNQPSMFLGENYGFHIRSEDNYVIIDSEYAAQYLIHERNGASYNQNADPVATLAWVMSGIPVPGKTVFVHPV
jgi:hypothetical protein